MRTALTHIHGVGHVAEKYGVEEAIFLDSILFWWRSNRGDNKNFHEGRWWTYNSLSAYTQLFPWWSEKQLRRVINSCKEQGALLTGNYNADRRDRTSWYTPSDELLMLYGETAASDCICPNGQMQAPERSGKSAQMGEPLPCIYHVDKIPPYSPPMGDGVKESGRKKNSRKNEPKATADWESERFDGFWRCYPIHKAKQDAIRAWDKLRPRPELIDTMAKALKVQMATEEWQRGIGVPYASTWINQRRWEDEVNAPVSKTAGSWAPDPEVY
jgi:hypothetical protein